MQPQPRNRHYFESECLFPLSSRNESASKQLTACLHGTILPHGAKSADARKSAGGGKPKTADAAAVQNAIWHQC